MEKSITTNYTDEEFRKLVREEVKVALSENHSSEPDKNIDGFVNINEALNILDLSKSTIYKMVHFGKIPFFKQGPKKLVFKRADLLEWLRQNRNLDKNGTNIDGWNEKLQQHVVYEQPPKDWTDRNWK